MSKSENVCVVCLFIVNFHAELKSKWSLCVLRNVSAGNYQNAHCCVYVYVLCLYLCVVCGSACALIPFRLLHYNCMGDCRYKGGTRIQCTNTSNHRVLCCECFVSCRLVDEFDAAYIDSQTDSLYWSCSAVSIYACGKNIFSLTQTVFTESSLFSC